MKKWLSKNWDEVIVYIVTLFGAFCEMVYSARIAKTVYHVDWLYLVLGAVASAAAAWLAENRGIAFAKKIGVTVSDAKTGRRKNIVFRLLLGFGFGFWIMAALPSILQGLVTGAPSIINGMLTGGAQ
jgi:hypothetical protein